MQKYVLSLAFFRAIFPALDFVVSIHAQKFPAFLTIRAHPAIIYCGFLVAPWWLSMAPAAIDVRRPGCPRLEPGTVRPSIGNFYNIAGQKDNGTARGKSVASMPKCVRMRAPGFACLPSCLQDDLPQSPCVFLFPAILGVCPHRGRKHPHRKTLGVFSRNILGAPLNFAQVPVEFCATFFELAFFAQFRHIPILAPL